ncbi:MAG TPA: hypothetical protein VGL05_19650 [Kribbella sp.]
MIREDKFVISHAPYAVKLDSLARETYYSQVQVHYRYSIEAAWFRRRNGRTVACLGYLHTSRVESFVEAAPVLEGMTDGRYGGDCKARWDGDNLWAPQSTWDQMTTYEEFLRPMLENFPEVPPLFDGWWTFKGAK